MKQAYDTGSATTLITILISVALIGWMFTRVYLTPREDVRLSEVRSEISTGTPPATAFDAARQDVESAKAVQAELNAHNAEINSILGE